MFAVALLRRCAFSVLMLFIAVAVQSLPMQTVSPDVLIKTVTEEVLMLMRQERQREQGGGARVTAMIEEKIAPHLNFEQMTILAVGPRWRDATNEERSSLVREFHTLLMRTYGALLYDYRDQAIVFLPLRAAPTDTDVTVRARIAQTGGEVIIIAIRMKKLPEGWKAHDIVIDGVSLILAYRGTFREEIERSGISGLIKVLAEKNR